MNHHLTDTLDTAIARLQHGETLSAILMDYPAEAEFLRPLLEAATMFVTLPPVEMPSPAALQADRADFLADVVQLQQQAVSPGPLARLKEGVVHLLPWSLTNLTYHRKGQRRMGMLLIKAMLVVGLVFGSAGATAAMAANSLPDSPLYPVKLALEDARLAVTTDPAQQGKLHLAMAQVRTQEMEQLALKGELPAEAVTNRLQLHLNQALQMASELPQAEMAGLLSQTREMAQAQSRELAQTQTQVGEPLQEPLRQANRLLNQVGQEAEAGLQDPLAFRQRFGQNRPEDAPLQPEPAPGVGRAADPTDEPLPPAEPEPTVEPTTEPVVNPDCPSGQCEPIGDQNQIQNQNRYGHDSDSLSGHYGEPCDSQGDGSCEPVGDEHKYGQDETVEPGHHGDNCDQSGDCVPVGDQNQFGQETNQSAGPLATPACTDDSCDPAQNQQQEQPAEPPADSVEPAGPPSEPGGDSAGGGHDSDSDGGGQNDSDSSHGGGRN